MDEISLNIAIQK